MPSMGSSFTSEELPLAAGAGVAVAGATMVVLMRKSANGHFVEDANKAPLLVPASSLGCKLN
eukprot:6040343-Prymnesium_polylepis.1